MLLSKALPILKSLRNINKPKRNMCSHNWYYRKVEPSSRKVNLAANAIQGVAWWWILWHLWTEPDHVLGEFLWPSPSKWTDEELGIPACLKDDEVPDKICDFYKTKPEKEVKRDKHEVEQEIEDIKISILGCIE